jgi:glucose-6-phosphate 1-dehydrogenase
MTGRPAPVHTGELPVATPPRVAGPCTIVILGAAGDLARRKLLPSLLHLQGDGLLHDGVRVIGVGRPELSDSAFREEVRKALDPEPALWQRFAPRLSWIAGDLAMASTYQTIREQLELFEAAPGEPRGRLFYLAVPPSLYETVVQGLDRSDAVSWQDDPRDPRWTRVVIEKPFGGNLETARALNRVLAEVMAEHQIYRIDHYLGKETVQNLMVFRFANSIFEPVWNRHHIHHVQITAAETLGVEHRAGYYEEAGVVRDMFQNHLLQLLALSAMEPPVTSRADAVRDEKVKVLRAIRPIPESELARYAVRGQYAAGSIEGSPVPGYRQEPGVAPGSRTPTYAAIRVMVDNWRWQGVPFYLRSGKAMSCRTTQIVIQFREPPHQMFPKHSEANRLVIQVQPAEGIQLHFQTKVPDAGMDLRLTDLDFSYQREFRGILPEAYERLLQDVLAGDASLFARADEVELAWGIIDPILATWDATGEPPVLTYEPGLWGPMESIEWMHRQRREWFDACPVLE